ncbi:hypothetical protein NEF87_000821 [Candidatus Lokiarchaeum ossiferum]|uniref:Uncharacterized protein n=1 Tax=Candidatus Lokiarchaeum ossiferum TaxID=2951803 RepID=A0ABY6HPR8_9ARCH|nr:hypothetical protein NEF87_000821 [Candidatus Lokiarchaeum sp. B-35]
MDICEKTLNLEVVDCVQDLIDQTHLTSMLKFDRIIGKNAKISLVFKG